MLRIATVTDPFKLVLPLNFNVGHDHSQHLFMNVDSRYPVRHNVSSWRERRACCDILKQGHRLSPLPQEGRDNAQLFAQPRTLRIRHIDSVNISTEASISPLRASPILHRLGVIFMSFRGPNALLDRVENPPCSCRSAHRFDPVAEVAEFPDHS